MLAKHVRRGCHCNCAVRCEIPMHTLLRHAALLPAHAALRHVVEALLGHAAALLGRIAAALLARLLATVAGLLVHVFLRLAFEKLRSSGTFV